MAEEMPEWKYSVFNELFLNMFIRIFCLSCPILLPHMLDHSCGSSVQDSGQNIFAIPLPLDMLQKQHGQTSPHPAARRRQVIASVQLKANSRTNNKQSTMFMLPMHEDFCPLLETAAGPSCRFDSMLHL